MEEGGGRRTAVSVPDIKRSKRWRRGRRGRRGGGNCEHDVARLVPPYRSPTRCASPSAESVVMMLRVQQPPASENRQRKLF